MREIYFVTGIGTGIGKSVCSAILVEGLSADYWKPVQCGDADAGDPKTVASLVRNKRSQFFKSTYCFQAALSPDAAAAMEGIEIELAKLIPPEGKAPLIIEGAGGVLVPLNRSSLVIDLINPLKASAIIVSRGYLGTINHTLLTVEALRSRNIPIKGLIFNGNFPPHSKESIVRFSKLAVLADIPELPEIDAEVIASMSDSLQL